MVAGRIWKGGILVADIKELGKLNASEIHARRLDAKEVTTFKKRVFFYFPLADATAKLLGGDHEI